MTYAAWNPSHQRSVPRSSNELIAQIEHPGCKPRYRVVFSPGASRIWPSQTSTETLPTFCWQMAVKFTLPLSSRAADPCTATMASVNWRDHSRGNRSICCHQKNTMPLSPMPAAAGPTCATTGDCSKMIRHTPTALASGTASCATSMSGWCTSSAAASSRAIPIEASADVSRLVPPYPRPKSDAATQGTACNYFQIRNSVSYQKATGAAAARAFTTSPSRSNPRRFCKEKSIISSLPAQT